MRPLLVELVPGKSAVTLDRILEVRVPLPDDLEDLRRRNIESHGLYRPAGEAMTPGECSCVVYVEGPQGGRATVYYLVDPFPVVLYRINEEGRMSDPTTPQASFQGWGRAQVVEAAATAHTHAEKVRAFVEELAEENTGGWAVAPVGEAILASAKAVGAILRQIISDLTPDKGGA